MEKSGLGDKVYCTSPLNFEDVAERQYTRDLLFSSVVELMSLVVCRIQSPINVSRGQT